MIAFKTVEELVDNNHACAYVLDCYGIEFYRCSEKSLAEVCEQSGLNTDHVCHNLGTVDKLSTIDLAQLHSYPANLVIEYLKHAHHIFVKKSLPYMGKLIRNLEPNNYVCSQVVEDIMIVFPLFAEDFIHHIYEEEDHLFHYVNQLIKVAKGKIHSNKIFPLLEAITLQALAADHENADDEMRGMRRLTKNYTIGADRDLHLRTIYKELMQFERELVFHANVENEVLFPKAIELEMDVKQQMSLLRGMN